MEFGLSEALPIYSGGLGILAGDFLKTASDLGVPLTGVGLLYQQGYFRQVLAEDGSQVEAVPYNNPDTLPLEPVRDKEGGRLRVMINLPGRPLLLRVWRANVCRVNLYLLDANDPMNSPRDRAITANLYAPGEEQRLLQEIVLGIGGWQALKKMGIEPEVCHLNEGHAAFVVLARAHSFMREAGCSLSEALWATRAGNVFTTHTPVPAGFDRFDWQLVIKYAKYYADLIGLPYRRSDVHGRRDPSRWGRPVHHCSAGPERMLLRQRCEPPSRPRQQADLSILLSPLAGAGGARRLCDQRSAHPHLGFSGSAAPVGKSVPCRLRAGFYRLYRREHLPAQRLRISGASGQKPARIWWSTCANVTRARSWNTEPRPRS